MYWQKAALRETGGPLYFVVNQMLFPPGSRKFLPYCITFLHAIYFVSLCNSLLISRLCAFGCFRHGICTALLIVITEEFKVNHIFRKGFTMKKGTVFVLAIAVAVLSCVGYSGAAVLGTIEHSRAGSDLGDFSEMNFSICYPLHAALGFDWSISLSWDGITPDDVGKTFFASANTHQNFDVFTFPLTNGIDNLLYLPDIGSLMTNYDLPGTKPESSLISGIQDGVDFEGYTIDSIALTVNELFLDYDADAIKGGLTNYSYDITYSINGEMIANPEPATVFLLGLGGLALRKRRKA